MYMSRKDEYIYDKKTVSKTPLFTEVTRFFLCDTKKSELVKVQVKRKLVQHQDVIFPQIQVVFRVSFFTCII